MNINTLDSHGYFEPSSEKQQNLGMKALMATLRKIAIVEVTCWELKFHQLKALLVLLTLSYGAKGFSFYSWGHSLLE